jgi:hypothetical protein
VRKDINAEVIAKTEKFWEPDDIPIWMHWEYRILKCRGCDEVYFQTQSRFSEDSEYEEDPIKGKIEEHIDPTITYWPKHDKYVEPDWLRDISKVDPRLAMLCSEIYTAANNDLSVLAAIGIRTALDHSLDHFDIASSLSFKRKLQALVDKGIIGTQEKSVLDLVTEAGHAAAHRAWRPTDAQLRASLVALEGYLRRAFITDRLADASLRGQVPARSKSGREAPDK